MTNVYSLEKNTLVALTCMTYPCTNYALRTDKSFANIVNESHHHEGQHLFHSGRVGMVSQFHLHNRHSVCLCVVMPVLHIWHRGPLNFQVPANIAERISAELKYLPVFLESLLAQITEVIRSLKGHWIEGSFYNAWYLCGQKYVQLFHATFLCCCYFTKSYAILPHTVMLSPYLDPLLVTLMKWQRSHFCIMHILRWSIWHMKYKDMIANSIFPEALSFF